jgi:hypothetical protein
MSTHGGRRRGSGRKRFVATDEQRRFVKMLVGSGRPHQQICLAIINPGSKKPLSPGLFAKVFKDEILVGRIEADTVVSVSMFAQIRKLNTAMTIWYQKNNWGWRDHPEPTKRAGNDDYAGGPRTVRVIVEGGLPQGSTPEKPEGDNYSDVPPEEAPWAAPARRTIS